MNLKTDPKTGEIQGTYYDNNEPEDGIPWYKVIIGAFLGFVAFLGLLYFCTWLENLIIQISIEYIIGGILMVAATFTVITYKIYKLTN